MSGKKFCLAGMLWLTSGDSASWPAETVKEAGAEMQQQARVATMKLLSGVTPRTGDPKETIRLIDNRYVLWGEIFEPGRVIALIGLEPQGSIADETPKGLALALWNSGSWQFEQVIDIPIFWRSPSIPEDDRQFLPKRLPEKAFWLCRLGPARHAVLVVSTLHSRYRSGHCILEYDPKSHRLQTTAQFSVDEPVWRDGYVVLTNDSGRKAWWSEESFYQFKDHRLRFCGALRTGSYNAEDFFIHITFPVAENAQQQSGTKWRFVSTPDAQSIYKVYLGEEQESDPPVLGEVHFSSVENFADRGPYSLQKLTGIPVSVALRFGEEPPERGRAIADAEIKVKGSPELIRSLGVEERK